jgi:uncharacterized protein (DUF302 family)/uncharacterized membrane protein YidH (DUF202 family)
MSHHRSRAEIGFSRIRSKILPIDSDQSNSTLARLSIKRGGGYDGLTREVTDAGHRFLADSRSLAAEPFTLRTAPWHSEEMADRSTSGPSDYLAAERTLLAWIRTGLALMGFGFVVARFGLFLQALQVGQPNFQARPYGLSFWFGTALIVLGVIVNLVCAWSHVRLVHELNRGGSAFNRPSSLAIAIAVTLAVLGLAMAIYLVSVREPGQTHLEVSKEKSMPSIPENGIVTIPSHHSVDETVEKLEKVLQAKGVKLFALIDHSGEAEKAGLQMRPTKVLIFGNPKAGTPLMVAVPSIAIDLPLKVLVREDAAGSVWISYNDPAYLQSRHRLPQDLVQNIAAAEALARTAAE